MPSLMHGGLPSPVMTKLRTIAAARPAPAPPAPVPPAMGAGQAKADTLARMGYGGGVLRHATQLMADRQRRRMPPPASGVSPTAATATPDPAVLYAGS
jgi:hypothetical protein